MATKTFSPTVPVFDSALKTFGELKAQLFAKIGAKQAKIIVLRAQIAKLSKGIEADMAGVEAELTNYVQIWADENSGSYVSELGKISIVRGHTRRHWDAAKLDALLESNPLIRGALETAYHPDEIGLRFNIEPK